MTGKGTRGGWLPAGLISSFALAGPAGAQSENLGQIATGLTTQITQIGNLVGVGGMLIGLAMLVMSGVKFRAWSTNPQDPHASFGGAVGWLIAGVALVALPEFMGVGVSTLFGDDGQAGNFVNPLTTTN